MELLQSLRLFVKLAELQSFTKTAEALEIGRPQVTQAINRLETSLGARLFQRTTRKVSLTADGEAFLVKAGEVLAAVDDAVTLFSTSATLRGRLRIDLPAAFAVEGFMQRLGQFRETHPGVTLTLGIDDRPVDLVAEGVDCAIRMGELPSSSLIARRLGAARMVTCAAPGYLARHPTPATPDDLARHACVRYLSGLRKRTLPWEFTVNGDTQTLSPTGTILVNDAIAYVHCARASFGIIQAPGILVEQHLRDGSLIEILAHHRPTPRPVALVYPSRSHLTPAVRAFAEWLQEGFRSIAPDWLE